MILQTLSPIQTRRLSLEPPTPEEAEALAEIINASFGALRPWVGFIDGPTNTASVRAATERAQVRIAEGSYMQWRIRTRHDRALIGCVDVHDIDADVPKAELGFWLSSAATGQGYAQEAVYRVLIYLLVERGFARVELRCDTRNARAIAVAERLGIPREGIARNVERDPDGNLVDNVIFAICAAGHLR
jgi:RimJ/RimL family protein N-acetyltransferase